MKGDDTPKTEISNINYLVDKWFIFPLWLAGWYHLTDIQLFYLILVEMLKGTPVCNLYVFGLELSSKAIIITQRNTNTEAWYMIMNFQQSETRNSKTNRRHSSINCKENEMQLPGTIKGNNSASSKKSSTTSVNSLKPEKLLQLFFFFFQFWQHHLHAPEMRQVIRTSSWFPCETKSAFIELRLFTSGSWFHP